MNLRKIILIGVAVILLLQTNSYCRPNQAPPPGFATRLDYLKSLTNEAVIVAAFKKGLISDDEQMEAIAIEVSNRHYTNMADVNQDYRSGIIGKGEAMMATRMLEAAKAKKEGKPMDIYGKVVDQDSQPVVSAKVRGFLLFGGVNYEDHYTTTDAQGQFHFLGLKGHGLGIFPEKEGYEFNRNIRFAVHRPDNYFPNPTNPLVIHMWKLRGGESMSHALIYSSVPCDGRFKRFNLHSFYPEGTDTKNGELMIKLTRGLLITNQGVQQFAWNVTFEITNGGLLAFNEPYPYNAPLEGYQPSATLDGPTNFVDWGNGLRQGYYFNSKGGQVYGRMDIRMMPGQSHASLRADIYANVTGSRNLELDNNKLIDWRQSKLWTNIWPNGPGWQH